MPTRNVVLTEHQHEFIDALVQSGRYQNASEVLRDGLRLVEERDQRHATALAALRAAIAEGFDDIAAGDYDEIDTDEIAGYLAALRPTMDHRASA